MMKWQLSLQIKKKKIKRDQKKIKKGQRQKNISLIRILQQLLKDIHFTVCLAVHRLLSSRRL